MLNLKVVHPNGSNGTLFCQGAGDFLCIHMGLNMGPMFKRNFFKSYRIPKFSNLLLEFPFQILQKWPHIQNTWMQSWGTLGLQLISMQKLLCSNLAHTGGGPFNCDGNSV